MSQRARTVWLLCAILIVAAGLRLPRLTRHDVIDDEALMAFRSIGWLDTWFGSMQSPVDLFPTEQWWQKLSFHDHPPLLFFVEHQFFRLFGPTEMALRLPFALAGIIVVWLMYLVGREIFGQRGGLWSAAAAAVANYAVWLSRVGFQEGLLLVTVLLALWFFLRSLDDPRFCLAVGAAVGLALLTKYSAVVLGPVITAGYLRYRPTIFRSPYAYLGAAVGGLVLSPVIIYNAMLYRTRGHFDATLWAMLGQTHPDFWSDYHAYNRWNNTLDWWHWMPDGFGWLLVVLAAAGAVLLAVRSLAAPTAPTTYRQRAARWTIVSLAVTCAVFFSLAPARKQYLGLAVVPVTLLTGYLLSSVGKRRWGFIAAVVSLMFVAGQTANTQLLAAPRGRLGLEHLALRPTSYVYRKLDNYLDATFAGQDPAVTTTKDQQLRTYIRRRLKERYGEENPQFSSRPPYVVLDQQMDFAALRWTMHRRDLYLYQPSIITSRLAEIVRLHGADYIENAGFNDFRFIFVEPSLLERSGAPNADQNIAKIFRRAVDDAGVKPSTIITDGNGTPTFAVYQLPTLGSLFMAPTSTAAASG